MRIEDFVARGIAAQDAVDLVTSALDALHRLIEIGHRDHGQAVRVRRFLLGLYNGGTFPFDLTDLRSLDESVQRDCLAVLAFDMQGRVEVHNWLPGTSRVIADWAQEAWPA